MHVWKNVLKVSITFFWHVLYMESIFPDPECEYEQDRSCPLLILIILLCRKPLRKPKKCCLWSSNPPWRPRWRKVGEIGKSNNHSKTWERLLVIQSDFYQLWNAQFSSIRSQDLRVLVITHGDVWLCARKQLYDRPRKQRDLQWRLKRRNFLKEKRKSPLSYRNSSNWTGKTISIPYLSITLYE